MDRLVDFGRYDGWTDRTMSDGVRVEVEFRTDGQIGTGPRGTLVMARPYGIGATYPDTWSEVWEVVVDSDAVPEVVDRMVDLAHRRFVHQCGPLTPNSDVPPLPKETT